MSNPKIDIYLLNRSQGSIWQYECSTTWAKTCREARIRFAAKHGLDAGQVKAVRAERKR